MFLEQSVSVSSGLSVVPGDEAVCHLCVHVPLKDQSVPLSVCLLTCLLSNREGGKRGYRKREGERGWGGWGGGERSRTRQSKQSLTPPHHHYLLLLLLLLLLQHSVSVIAVCARSGK